MEIKTGQCDASDQCRESREGKLGSGGGRGRGGVEGSSTAEPQPKHTYLLVRDVIAPKASGGAQVFGQGVERLGLLVEKPYLEGRGCP